MQVNMIGSCYLYSYHRKHSKEQRCSIYKFPSQLNSCFPLFRELLNLFLSRGISHLLQGFLYLFLLKVMLSMSIPRHPRDFSCSCWRIYLFQWYPQLPIFFRNRNITSIPLWHLSWYPFWCQNILVLHMLNELSSFSML